jgi:soluble lytic murein transglycosylase-like protein
VVKVANYYDEFYTGVNPDRVYQIESSGNPLAYNRDSGARGLGQITDIARRDYNKQNKENYQPLQLFDPQVNQKIAYWTLTQRIPSMLQSYGKEVTPENVLWAYHDGIGNVKKNYKSDAVKEYLRRYFGSGKS